MNKKCENATNILTVKNAGKGSLILTEKTKILPVYLKQGSNSSVRDGKAALPAAATASAPDKKKTVAICVKGLFFPNTDISGKCSCPVSLTITISRLTL